jgi:hypothetical protein
MNNLDIVLALFTTPNHRFSRLDTTAADSKPQQVQLQTGFSRTLPKHKSVKPMSSTSKTVLNSYD